MKTKTFTVEHRGRPEKRKAHYGIDVEAFRGCDGYALLFLAANPHLSATDVQRILLAEGVEKALRYLQKRRRWMFTRKGEAVANNLRDRDGKDTAAATLIAANSALSNAKLSALLAANGITRCEEWCRKRRNALK